MSDSFSLFDDGDSNTSPLDTIEYQHNVEGDSKKEMSATLAAFKRRVKVEYARVKSATDSEFWIAICFQSREQKDTFLQKTGLSDIGDKYLDGLQVADLFGIELPEYELSIRPRRVNQDLLKMVKRD